MELGRVVAEETGISTVIGIILLIAVTVILGTTLSTFVLDIGDSVDTSGPQVAFEADQRNLSQNEAEFVDWDADGKFKIVEITHREGATLDEENVRVLVDGETAYGSNPDTCPGVMVADATTLWQGTGEITAGDSVTVVSGSNVLDDKDPTDGDCDYFYDDGESTYPGSGPFNKLVYQDQDTDEEYGRNVQLDRGETVRVVWVADSGTKSTTLLRYEVK